jgi:hypothetical protein
MERVSNMTKNCTYAYVEILSWKPPICRFLRQRRFKIHITKKLYRHADCIPVCLCWPGSVLKTRGQFFKNWVKAYLYLPKFVHRLTEASSFEQEVKNVSITEPLSLARTYVDPGLRGQFFKTSVGANSRVGANSAKCHRCVGASSLRRRKCSFKKLASGPWPSSVKYLTTIDLAFLYNSKSAIYSRNRGHKTFVYTYKHRQFCYITT